MSISPVATQSPTHPSILPAAVLPDVRTLTTPEQISARLALIARREADLTLALNALISDRSGIESAFSRLRVVGGQIGVLATEVDGDQGGRGQGGALVHAQTAPPFGASLRGLGLQNGEEGSASGYGNGDGADGEDREGLVERIRRVWETSERVGGKVRKLDTEISRVKEAVDIVTEVMELKVSPSASARPS